MRTRTIDVATFVVALAALLPAGSAPASDAPLQCTTNRGGNWTVTTSGPVHVPCPGGGECTTMEYDIVSNKKLSPAYVAILVEHDLAVVAPATGVYEPCSGDPVTRLGCRDCSSKAVRLHRDKGSGLFEVVGEGNKDVIGASIVVKAGDVIEECRIASLGRLNFDVNAQVASSQQIVFKGCTVTIPTDSTTGEGGVATITGPNCVFVANAAPVSAGELLVDGKSVGALTFGEGSVSSGTSSCTTKVISRKLYTWCTCADVNGDGIPDDPKPPCPAHL